MQKTPIIHKVYIYTHALYREYNDSQYTLTLIFSLNKAINYILKCEIS